MPRQHRNTFRDQKGSILTAAGLWDQKKKKNLKGRKGKKDLVRVCGKRKHPD